MQRKALGKGLSALIPDRPIAIEHQGTGFLELPVQEISPNPHQPRKAFDPEGMADLANSIKARGVVQPILVRQGKAGFELIAGERRWRAAKQAGIASIPVIICQVSDQDSLELALIENLQREDLNPMESAEAYERLIRDFRLTQEEVSRKVGKKRSTVTNVMRLLSLPAELKDYVRQDKLTLGHAKAILSLPGKSQRMAAGRQIVRKGLSVRQAERLVQGASSVKSDDGTPSPGKRGDVHLQAVEEELKRHLGTKVRIVDRKGRGKIEIEYYSKKERERLISVLRQSEPR